MKYTYKKTTSYTRDGYHAIYARRLNSVNKKEKNVMGELKFWIRTEVGQWSCSSPFPPTYSPPLNSEGMSLSVCASYLMYNGWSVLFPRVWSAEYRGHVSAETWRQIKKIVIDGHVQKYEDADVLNFQGTWLTRSSSIRARSHTRSIRHRDWVNFLHIQIPLFKRNILPKHPWISRK